MVPFNATVKLETLARQNLLQNGEHCCSPEEMARVGARYGDYGLGLPHADISGRRTERPVWGALPSVSIGAGS